MAHRLRLAAPADAAAVAAIYRPFVEESVVSFETTAPGAEEMGRRIEATLAMHPWLVEEVDGGVAGYAYAGPYRKRDAYQWSVETSVYVAADHRRRGVGRRLYAALFDVLRAQGLVNAFAGIALPNPASVAFHESMGFAPVGTYRHVGHKFGAWHDVGWWALELAAPGRNPAPPRPVAELRDAGVVAALLRGRAETS